MVAVFAIALAYFILGTTSEVFAFCNVPTITSISPASGSTSGGTSVTITGTDFGCGVKPVVKFGSNLAFFTLLSDTQITATSPPGVGTADVTVTTDGGTSPTSAADQFTYTASPPTVTSISPNNGLTSGGTVVAISGTNFIGATSIKFGSTGAALFTVLTPNLIAVSSPAGSGTVDVTVTTAAGTSAISTADQFTYVRGQSTVSLVSSLNPSQFGQSVTFVATISSFNGQPSGTVTFKDNGTTLTTVALSAGSASYATASLTRGSHSISATYNGDGNFEGSTSAALVQAVNVPADSVKLKALQNQVSPLVAQISAAAVTGAIDGAIGDAFGNGGDAVTMGPNGMTLNFTAEPRSEVTRRADAAFATLGYGTSSNVNKAPPLSPTKEREWSVWTNLRGTGWESNNNSTADLKGSQLNLTAGIGRKFTPDLLVGIVAGYEQFKYDSVALGGAVKGNGGTVGSYAAWRFAPTLRWDAKLAWSAISYDAVAGTASGNFIGHRWLASTGLTGNYHLASFVFEPSAKVYALWERQGEWTDSLGTPQTARSFSAGQVVTGGKVSAPWQLSSSRVTVAPYVGFYGDWRFKSDDAVPAGQPVVGIGNGWSGRVTSGISVVKAGGGMLALGGEYGGIGANYKVWTANGRVSWRF
jgi:hypothetical protein